MFSGLTDFSAVYPVFISSTNCSGDDSSQKMLPPGRCGSFHSSHIRIPGYRFANAFRYSPHGFISNGAYER